MSWLKKNTLDRVLIHTTDGATFDGLIQSVERRAVVLVAASYHSADTEQAVELGGETYVPRDRIAFMQRPQ